MIDALSKHIVFLHGLSGSGKGEFQKQLTSEYEKNGYQITYVSAGDILRASLANPLIERTVVSGGLLDTLQPLQEGLTYSVGSFINNFHNSSGQAVMIIDNVVRRSRFVRSDGTEVTSQLTQLAEIVDATLGATVKDSLSLANVFPEYKYSPQNTSKVESALEYAFHVVTDVVPEDAQKQMEKRAQRELTLIQDTIKRYRDEGKGVSAQWDELAGITNMLYMISEQREGNPDALLLDAKKQLGKLVEAASMASLSELYRHFDITSGIREDDISSISRGNRVDNFVRSVVENGTHQYELGNVGQLIVNDLGFSFNSETGFSPRRANNVVIKNGELNGVSLATFQETSRNIAKSLYTQTETSRELHGYNKEGRWSRGRERV